MINDDVADYEGGDVDKKMVTNVSNHHLGHGGAN